VSEPIGEPTGGEWSMGVCGPTIGVVAYDGYDIHGVASVPRTADALLMACAKDLLHFAKWSAQLCEGPFPLTPEQVMQCLPARAHELIAKAEGR
jgi:hypothetical protein